MKNLKNEYTMKELVQETSKSEAWFRKMEGLGHVKFEAPKVRGQVQRLFSQGDYVNALWVAGLSSVGYGPIYLYMKVCEGIPVFLLNSRVLLNQEGVIHIQEFCSEIQETGFVKITQILIEIFIEGEIGKVLHILFNELVLREKTEIIFQVRTDGAFTEYDDKRIEKL